MIFVNIIGNLECHSLENVSVEVFLVYFIYFYAYLGEIMACNIDIMGNSRGKLRINFCSFYLKK